VSGLENDEKQNWAASPSTVFNHFATSGLSVAVATAITHPLGAFLCHLLLLYVYSAKGCLDINFGFLKLFFFLHQLPCIFKCCYPDFCILQFELVDLVEYKLFISIERLLSFLLVVHGIRLFLQWSIWFNLNVQIDYKSVTLKAKFNVLYIL